jgi:hypothetical protein
VEGNLFSDFDSDVFMKTMRSAMVLATRIQGYQIVNLLKWRAFMGVVEHKKLGIDLLT